MITTGAAVCGPRHISNPCDLAAGNQERVVSYYEVATNGHGRVDPCTGRLEPRWRRAVHSAARPINEVIERDLPDVRQWRVSDIP
jgi:hypothetical protein